MKIEILIELVMMIVIGSTIGWVTNYVAIKMLFRPYKEVRILFFRVQGLLPKRKHQIGESIANVVQQELLSVNDVINSLDRNKLEEKMKVMIDKILDEKLEREINGKFPMFAMFLSKEILDKIKLTIRNSILDNKDAIISMFLQYVEENVDFRDIIVKKVDEFSLEKLEKIVYEFSAKELKHIEVVGAVLGGIIGVIQFFIGKILQGEI